MKLPDYRPYSAPANPLSKSWNTEDTEKSPEDTEGVVRWRATAARGTRAPARRAGDEGATADSPPIAIMVAPSSNGPCWTRLWAWVSVFFREASVLPVFRFFMLREADNQVKVKHLASIIGTLSLLGLAACDRDKSPVLNGRVEAYLTDLGPRVSGRLTELKVQEGQRFKQGDLLARITAEELDAAVTRDVAAFRAVDAKRLELSNGTRPEDIAQGEARVHDAEAALKMADSTLRRTQQLLVDKIISQADLDKAQTERERASANLNLQQKGLLELKAGARSEQRAGASADAKRAQATLDQTRVQASFTEIRAPFDGLIVHRLREVGSVLQAGQPVLTLARTDKLWVRVYLPQQIQARAHLGMAVTVLTPDKRSLDATLDEVASEPEYTPKMVETREERVNLVYPARVNIPKGFDLGLLPGLAVDVKLSATPASQGSR